MFSLRSHCWFFDSGDQVRLQLNLRRKRRKKRRNPSNMLSVRTNVEWIQTDAYPVLLVRHVSPFLVETNHRSASPARHAIRASVSWNTDRLQNSDQALRCAMRRNAVWPKGPLTGRTPPLLALPHSRSITSPAHSTSRPASSHAIHACSS